ncbi:MAG: tetratricopeptide repeat protein [Bacteroidota bacterium]
MIRTFFYASFILCFLTLSFNVYSGVQSPVPEDNERKIAFAGDDSVSVLINLIEAYRHSDPEKAIAVADSALNMIRRSEEPGTTAEIFTHLGHIYFEMGVYYQALNSYSSALSKYLNFDNKVYVASCLNNIGSVYHQLNMHGLAQKSFEQAARIFQEYEFIVGLAMSYNHIGNSYCEMGEFDIAMQYYNDVLDLDSDSISPQIRACTYSNIGKVFLCRGDYDLSREFNNRAMEIYSRLENQKAIAEAHEHSGNIAYQNGDLMSAMNEYGSASELYSKIQNKKALANSLLLQSEIKIESGNYNEAIQLANEAMSFAQAYRYRDIIKKAYLLLSELYTHLDDIHTAHEYYLHYSRVKDSVYSQELISSIAETETIITFLKYEIDIDHFEENKTYELYSKRFIMILLSLLLLTVILTISQVISQRRANRILAHQRNILKKTLSEHRISEMKYKALFSQANDAIFIMNQETFVDCNEKTLEMFACKRDDIIGHPPYTFSPDIQPDGKDSKEKALQLIEGCYKGEAQRFYWVHTRKDGTPFDAEVSLNVVKLEGSTYVQAIVRNISERVRAEKEMVQAREKAENATQSKTFFLAKMSHEIRTMLGGITSSSQLLKGTKVDTHQEELLGIINTSADNLLSIVNEILDLSKIEAGKIDVESRPFKLRKAIENTVNTYKQKSKEKNIALYLSIHPKIPEFIIGDELRIKQVLANLLSNAIKFTQKGNVTCELSLVKEYVNSYLIGIKISDSGIGIPANKIKDMFAEYSQSDVSISRQYGGTGLGLNIVYKLVNLMKGTIEVSSKLNEGTQFIINLPLQKTEETPVEDPGISKLKLNSLKKYKILLAEDNIINRKVTVINLENLGYHVDIAKDGNQTWDKYRQKGYDIILMDIHMPGLDGIEVTRMIRKHEKSHPGKSRTRIIALTANILSQDADYCLSEGMDAYISKPFKVEDIIASLDSED